MQRWFYWLGGAVLLCMVMIVAVLGLTVLNDNNVVVLQNQSPVAIDVTIAVTDEPMRWQMHLPAQACTLVQFHVRGDSALTTTITGLVPEQSGYYTNHLGSVDCFALPDGNCDIAALRCSALVLP